MENKIAIILTRIQNDQKHPQRDPAGPHKEKLEDVRQWLLREFTQLASKVAKIRDDQSLTDIGKRQQEAELVKKFELRGLTIKRTETQANLESVRSRLFPRPQPTGDPVLSFLREQEFRYSLKDQPQSTILAALAQAIKDGNQERVQAITAGPVGSLVPDDITQRLQIEHAQRVQPTLYENFHQLQILDEHLNSLETHATQVLQALGASTSMTA